MRGFVPLRLGAIELIELGTPVRFQSPRARQPFLASQYPRSSEPHLGQAAAKTDFEKLLGAGLIVASAAAVGYFVLR